MGSRNDGGNPINIKKDLRLDSEVDLTKAISTAAADVKNLAEGVAAGRRDPKELEAAQENYKNLAKIYTARVEGQAQISSQLASAEKNNEGKIIVAKIEGAIQIEAAKIGKEADIAVAKIQTDHNVLDSNEAKAYELIKKTGILNDPTALQARLNAGDKEAQKDVLELEKALKKDGKDLTADGKITDKTITAARGLIGENLDAIKKYEEVIDKLSNKSPAVGAIANGSEKPVTER